MIDNLVQLEEDFNSLKTSSENSPKTSENSWEHWQTFKINWYHFENNWGLLIDKSVQFEEDYNSRTKKLRWGGWVGWDGYLRPDQFLDHLTVIIRLLKSRAPEIPYIAIEVGIKRNITLLWREGKTQNLCTIWFFEKSVSVSVSVWYGQSYWS